MLTESNTRSLVRSQVLKQKTERVIPGCSQTFSKAPMMFVQGVSPVFLEKGKGAYVWDVDSNRYIDWTMALCAVSLGYADEEVNDAVYSQMQQGISFTLPHPLEEELAAKLVDLIPCAEMVRFGKNGSDATAGAVRLARGVTGRDMIACSGYHGWQDWYIGTTTRNRGIPKVVCELTKTFSYNDLASLHSLFKAYPGQIAGVVMEPTGVVPPKAGFLEGVRDLCTREGALLIFDEIVTGFRMSLGGAQAYFKVTPDLSCFGKAMANGFPISAVVGPEKYMRLFNELFFSFTFGGEAVSLAASLATIRKMQEKDFIAFVWRQGQKLQDGINHMARDMQLTHLIECVGYPPRSVLYCKDASGKDSLIYRSYFQQECMKRGILFTASHNVSFSHTDEMISETLEVYRIVMDLLKEAIRQNDVEKRLEGKPIETVFRRP
jgi:glutamate-1-semialdehyde aminotransferase